MRGTVFLIRGESPVQRRLAAERVAAAMAAPTVLVTDADAVDDDEIRLRLADGEAVICIDETAHERVRALAVAMDVAVADASAGVGAAWTSLDSLDVVSDLLAECSGGLRNCYGRHLPQCLRHWAETHPEGRQCALRLADTSETLSHHARLALIARSDLWQRQKARF